MCASSAQGRAASELARPLRIRSSVMPTQLETTLLDLVNTMTDLTEDENEVLATVTHLVNSGKVVLRGNFAGRPIPAG